jgi:hypothetical protein
MFNSGFNMTLGGGLSYFSMPATTLTGPGGTTVTLSSFSGISPLLEFSLGFAF